MRFALQAVTPEELQRRVAALTLTEARKIVAAVHRGEELSSFVPQVRRLSLAAVQAVGDVPRLVLGVAALWVVKRRRKITI